VAARLVNWLSFPEIDPLRLVRRATARAQLIAAQAGSSIGSRRCSPADRSPPEAGRQPTGTRPRNAELG
jgi:hypothetical protein